MIDAATTEEVFGGAGGVALGLKFLRDKLSGATEPGDMEVARYVISLLHLERQFEKTAGRAGRRPTRAGGR